MLPELPHRKVIAEYIDFGFVCLIGDSIEQGVMLKTAQATFDQCRPERRNSGAVRDEKQGTLI